jgi:hypothetical protein
VSRSPLYVICVLLLVTGIISACTGCSKQKKLNDRVTLWRKDKIPYGTFYAYENLQRLFPAATIINNKVSPDPYRQKNVREIFANTSSSNSHKTSNVVIATRVLPDEKELDALFSKVYKGEQVFISSLNIGENLLDSLQLKASFYTSYFNENDSLTVEVSDPVSASRSRFSYPGKAMDNYFTSMDSSITSVLGKDAQGRANFIKVSYENGGAFYIHLAPLALSNFFLLHKNNKSYYDQVLSYLPKDAEVINWDDYFRSSDGKGGANTRGGFSALAWGAKQPALAWGGSLLILLLLLIYLFESKRKQRIIPVIEPLKNASLDFVKTIGRMYFQRKDNKDLAYKMTAHFLGHVRSRYNIRGTTMDDDFVQRLAYKSGYDQQAIQALVYDLHFSQAQSQLSDHALLELNHKLETFYQFA